MSDKSPEFSWYPKDMGDGIHKRLMGGELVVVGKKLLAVCFDCGKVIRVDKPIVGSLHVCIER